MRNKFAEMLYKSAIEDSRIHIVVADISPAGSMAKFRNEFPERFINVGVAEQAMIGICAGLAREGAIPFAYTIAAFSVVRPFEFIRDDIALANLNVNIVGIGGGLVYSTLGPTHHTTDDIGLISLLPGMQIFSPADTAEVESVLSYRLGENQNLGPAYIRLGKSGEPLLPSSNHKEIDSTNNICKIKSTLESKVILIGYGLMAHRALALSEYLIQKFQINADVASMPFTYPINWTNVALNLENYSVICIIEEHLDNGSIGMQFASNHIVKLETTKILRFNLGSKFIKNYGSHEEVLNANGLSLEEMANTINENIREPK